MPAARAAAVSVAPARAAFIGRPPGSMMTRPRAHVSARASFRSASGGAAHATEAEVVQCRVAWRVLPRRDPVARAVVRAAQPGSAPDRLLRSARRTARIDRSLRGAEVLLGEP